MKVYLEAVGSTSMEEFLLTVEPRLGMDEDLEAAYDLVFHLPNHGTRAYYGPNDAGSDITSFTVKVAPDQLYAVVTCFVGMLVSLLA